MLKYLSAQKCKNACIFLKILTFPRIEIYTRKHRVTNPGSQKQSIFYAFFGFGFVSGPLVPENLLNLLWLILKPHKTFMHKHTFSGPGVRLKRARTLGPEKSRTLEFSNPADPDLGPGEFENHMKCFHVLTNPTHEMNFDLCFFFVHARNVPCSCSNRVRVHAYTNLWISYTHTFRVLNLENTQTHTG